MTTQSLYRRPLPEPLVPFASDEGRAIFREALAAGQMEGFFALAEQFHTQADPAFCGLGSLVVVLNALAIDPGRLWKGPWRWFSEDLLDCCKPLDRVRESGLSLNELACLGRCNGADARVERATLEELREDVRRATASAGEPILVASYDRRGLGQTGSGHFSPVGGYHPGRDLVLLLDVARFKYPPHWVSLEQLHAAMQSVDPESREKRGWIVFERRHRASTVCFTFSVQAGVDALVRAFASELPHAVADATDEGAALRAFAAAVERVGVVLETRAAAAPEHLAAATRLRASLRATRTFALAGTEAATTLALAAPARTWSRLAPEVGVKVESLLAGERALPEIASEIALVREQLIAIEGFIARRC